MTDNERWARNRIKAGKFPRWIWATDNEGSLECVPIIKYDPKTKQPFIAKMKRTFRVMDGIKVLATAREE